MGRTDIWWTDGRKDVGKDRRKDVGKDGRRDGQIDGQNVVDRQKERCGEGWTEGPTNSGQTDEWTEAGLRAGVGQRFLSSFCHDQRFFSKN